MKSIIQLSFLLPRITFVIIPRISAQAIDVIVIFPNEYGKSADSANKDYGHHKEVSVVVKVNLLYHLKTGYRNESVQGNAYAAHYAVRNCG